MTSVTGAVKQAIDQAHEAAETALTQLDASKPTGWSGPSSIAEEQARQEARAAGEDTIVALSAALDAAEALFLHVSTAGWGDDE
ncbi:hypothetical protein FYJ24_00080 [Actinomycetaceae bacterium WB03_NA08]|uniref:Uncharacterized protein n=1 Tax=Scrofimicrobium canadense TaxID=2652290 RepID=A0A6N7VQE8_9ACTO|nr:hypothetical protein [Scrofimicrobium canadense]MSS83190.1 hypothetical protein [Scrofimicrobium canadense]